MSEEVESVEVNAEAFRNAIKRGMDASNAYEWEKVKKKLKARIAFIERGNRTSDSTRVPVPYTSTNYVSAKASELGFSVTMEELIDETGMVDLDFSWAKE